MRKVAEFAEEVKEYFLTPGTIPVLVQSAPLCARRCIVSFGTMDSAEMATSFKMLAGELHRDGERKTCTVRAKMQSDGGDSQYAGFEVVNADHLPNGVYELRVAGMEFTLEKTPDGWMNASPD